MMSECPLFNLSKKMYCCNPFCRRYLWEVPVGSTVARCTPTGTNFTERMCQECGDHMFNNPEEVTKEYYEKRHKDSMKAMYEEHEKFMKNVNKRRKDIKGENIT